MIITAWTGVEVRAMRVDALRLTQREFAQLLGYTEAVVRKWESRRTTITLTRQWAAAMDTMYRRLDEDQRQRFLAAVRTDCADTTQGDPTVAQVEARLPDLRRALDTDDAPDDGPIRPIPRLHAAVAAAIYDRLNSNYLRLAHELPALLVELHRARAEYTDHERGEIDRLLVQAYRAADAVADKYGHYDLSARIITMMRGAANRTGDDLLLAATTYVRTETFFVNGQLATGRKLLERAADTIELCGSMEAAATFGALHMRAAVVAARELRPDDARAHLSEAENIARQVPENVYVGTAFGMSSVRIHQVSLGVELGDIGAALSAARNWEPPEVIPAERRSHFYIDAARAYLQAGRPEEAYGSVRTARSIAPQHTTNHPHVKDLLAQLNC
ncbi:hypothetical protein GZH49_10240 [Nocardia terpenica]|uniref:helix-turn-helix domain-containing protein n=1 Tax=Nocardia terpenica TaxID=455432 RepID=UPI002FE0F6E2